MDYISSEDKARLEEQLKACIDMRPKIVERIAEARALGDLKENAEYHAAREDQGMNEARINDLEEKLSNVVVADTEEVPDDMVFVGSTVRLKDTSTGNEECYKLVGEMTGSFVDDVIEVTPSSNLGLGLIKARVGETIRVELPRGVKTYEILEII